MHKDQSLLARRQAYHSGLAVLFDFVCRLADVVQFWSRVLKQENCKYVAFPGITKAPLEIKMVRMKFLRDFQFL